MCLVNPEHGNTRNLSVGAQNTHQTLKMKPSWRQLTQPDLDSWRLAPASSLSVLVSLPQRLHEQHGAVGGTASGPKAVLVFEPELFHDGIEARREDFTQHFAQQIHQENPAPFGHKVPVALLRQDNHST